MYWTMSSNVWNNVIHTYACNDIMSSNVWNNVIHTYVWINVIHSYECNNVIHTYVRNNVIHTYVWNNVIHTYVWNNVIHTYRQCINNKYMCVTIQVLGSTPTTMNNWILVSNCPANLLTVKSTHQVKVRITYVC